MHQIKPESDLSTTDDDSLYPYINNNIKYGLFEDIIDSYYLDSQIKDDFQCDQDCYSQNKDLTNNDHPNICTHDYHHIMQNIQDLTDNTQQNNLHSMEERASSFTDDTDTHCDYSISDYTSDTENVNDTHTNFAPKYPTIHSQRKHVYRDTFGDAHIQYHDFDNQDLLTFQDKYTALLQQELQNPYWNLHDPIATKSYQFSKDMDIETMPHAMYFNGDSDTVTKINQNLPLRPIEIQFENNHCCIEVHNTSDSTVEFLHGQEMAYFDARSKGIVQINNSKHFPIDQYLHDRMTPATLSPSPLAYEKLIHPAEMPCITICTELPVDNTNKSTPDDKYPWLDPDDQLQLTGCLSETEKSKLILSLQKEMSLLKYNRS